MRLFILFTAFLIFISCNSENADQSENNNDSARSEEAKIISAFDLEPGFAALDSLQILFFDDPYGDSLRYTRFFSFVNSNDTVLLNETKKHFQQPYTVKNSIDTCRSEGKIYLLAKGEPVKTLYFSSRCPECCYTYFIKDGAYYYFDMNESFRQKLSVLERTAKKTE
jgi:hypothetical protein